MIDLVSNVLLIALIGFVAFREGRSRQPGPVPTPEPEPVLPPVVEPVKSAKVTKTKTR